MLWWYFLGAILLGAGLAWLYEQPQGREMMLNEVRDQSRKRLAITCVVMCALWPLALAVALYAFIISTMRDR